VLLEKAGGVAEKILPGRSGRLHQDEEGGEGEVMETTEEVRVLIQPVRRVEVEVRELVQEGVNRGRGSANFAYVFSELWGAVFRVSKRESIRPRIKPSTGLDMVQTMVGWVHQAGGGLMELAHVSTNGAFKDSFRGLGQVLRIVLQTLASFNHHFAAGGKGVSFARGACAGPRVLGTERDNLDLASGDGEMALGGRSRESYHAPESLGQRSEESTHRVP